MRYVYFHSCDTSVGTFMQGWDFPSESVRLTIECAHCGERIAPTEMYDSTVYSAHPNPDW